MSMETFVIARGGRFAGPSPRRSAARPTCFCPGSRTGRACRSDRTTHSSTDGPCARSVRCHRQLAADRAAVLEPIEVPPHRRLGLIVSVDRFFGPDALPIASIGHFFDPRSNNSLEYPQAGNGVPRSQPHPPFNPRSLPRFRRARNSSVPLPPPAANCCATLELKTKDPALGSPCSPRPKRGYFQTVHD